LHFDDSSWVVNYLEGDHLRWNLGNGTIPPELLHRMDNPEYGDGRPETEADQPYGWETNEMSRELAHCHGQVVTGLAIGEFCYNFCFPHDLELDAMLGKDPQGMLCLRVFWEQW